MLNVGPTDSFLYFWITCVCAHICYVYVCFFSLLLFRHTLPDSCQAVAGAVDSSPAGINISTNVPLITNNTMDSVNDTFPVGDEQSYSRILSQAQPTSEDVERCRAMQWVKQSLHAKDPLEPEAITTAMLLKQIVSMHGEEERDTRADWQQCHPLSSWILVLRFPWCQKTMWTRVSTLAKQS